MFRSGIAKKLNNNIMVESMSRDSSVGIATDIESRDSSVGVAARYGLHGLGI